MSSELFFSSDLHLSHDNILTFKTVCRSCLGTGLEGVHVDGVKHCGDCSGSGEVRMREFSSVEEMDETIIERHNSVVRPQDHWWNLGDVCMHRQLNKVAHLLKRMNGHKRLLLGNHDQCKLREYLAHFEKVQSYRKIDGMMFSHIPIHPSSMGRSTANIHGHIHSNQGSFPPVVGKQMKFTGDNVKTAVETVSPYINLSVEVIDYTPVSLGQVKQMVEAAVKRWREVGSAASKG